MKKTVLYALLLLGPLSGTGTPTSTPADNARGTRRGDTPSLVRLTCEGLTAPLAIDTATPRFGWQLRSARQGDAQRSYRIDVALPPGVTATAITPGNACSGRLDGRKTAPKQGAVTIGSGRHRLVFGLRPRNETK